jgi:GPH family glycoside/pentoside/hexuronide:cation symporter
MILSSLKQVYSKTKIPWLFYVTGFFGVFLINSGLTSILLYRYDPGSNAEQLPVLVPAAIVGAAFFISRAIGAILQPVAGYLSDQTYGRWGKRRPYLAASILPVVGSFVLLFNPLINETSRGNNFYLISFLCLFYFALALYQVPYLAWLYELAPEDHQRIVLSSWLAISSLLGVTLGSVGTPWLSDRYGFTTMTWVIGGISFAALLLPLANSELASEKATTQRLPLLTMLEASWQNASFRPYALGISAALTALSILAVCPPFLAVALLHKDIGFGALINALVLGGSACSIVILKPAVKRFGKKRVCQFSMLWSGFGLLLLTITSVLLGPSLPLWFLLLPLTSLGLGCILVLPNAMMPDVIDQDAQFGQYAQAVYFGSRGLFKELSAGFGILIAGFLLSFGNSEAQPLGAQLSLMTAGLFAFVSAFFWMIYPISK